MTNTSNERRRLKSSEEVPIPSESLLTVDKENIPDEVIEELSSCSPEDSSTPQKILIEETPSEESSKLVQEPPAQETVDPEVFFVLEELLKAVDDENEASLIKKPKRKYVRRTFNNEPNFKKPKQEEEVELKEPEIPQPVMPFFINPNLGYHDLMMMLCVQMRVPYQYDINDRGRDLNGVMKNFIEKTKVIIKGPDEPGTVAEDVVKPLATVQESVKDEDPEVKPFSSTSSAFETFSEPKTEDISTTSELLAMQ